MKVLNLRCAETWLRRLVRVGRRLQGAVRGRRLACPLCGDTTIRRLPSAPRLNVTRHAAAPPDDRRDDADDAAVAVAEAVRHVISATEDVGDRFAEEARRIHYGEVEERGIRGRATSEDAAALREEGIAVMALSIPDALKGPLQ